MDNLGMGTEEAAPRVGTSERSQLMTDSTRAEEPDERDANERVDSAESEEEERFWPSLRDKVISWRSMQPPLKLITGVAVAQLLAAGAIIALHGAPGPQINLGLQSGHAVHMVEMYFWVSVAFTCISVSFLMSGALMMRWPVRLLALVIFTAFTVLPSGMPAYDWVRATMLVVLWLWAAVITLGRRADDQPQPTPLSPLARFKAWAGGAQMPVLTLFVVLIVQVVIYIAILSATGWTRISSNEIFQLTVQIQLQFLSLALVPFLVLAGTDFAELGELIGSGVARATSIKRMSASGWITLGLTALVAAGIFIYFRPTVTSVTDTALAYLGEFALAAAVAVTLWLLLRWGGATNWPALRVGALLLLTTTLVFIGLTVIEGISSLNQNPNVGRVTLTDYQVYSTPANVSPAFSLPYPAGWTPTISTRPDEINLIINGAGKTYPGIVMVESIPQPGATSSDATQHLITLLHGLNNVLVVTATGKEGAWATQQFMLKDPTTNTVQLVGEGWSQPHDGRDWAIIGLTTQASQPTLMPVFQSMAAAWRPNRDAQAPTVAEANTTAQSERASAIFLGLTPLAIGLTLGFWLVRNKGRHSSALRAAGVYSATFGLLASAQLMSTILQRVVGAPSSWAWFLKLSLPGLQQAVAAATLALVVYIVLRRRNDARWLDLARLALALNIGLLVIAGMIRLYDIAIGLSKSSSDHPISWAEALIVLIALGWDLVMSGEVFTNRDDKGFPRHTRLLLYMGYIMLTATLVMYFSAQSFVFGTAGAHEALFESEPWPQFGLAVLGLPMVITTFALAATLWAGRLRDTAKPAPDMEEAIATPAIDR